MSELLFRRKDLLQVLPYREWLRENMPNPRDGYTVNDLDLVLRVYGNNFRTDATGKFMLIELKFYPTWITGSQQATFRLIDSLLREADQERRRYLGYFVIQYTHENWDMAEFFINRKSVSKEQFRQFLLFQDISILGLFDQR